MNRKSVIQKTMAWNLGVTLVLAIVKIVLGLVTGSMALILDAVNYISDVLAALVVIIGMALAGKEADQKHPFGYGRVEYLSTMIIALIVLYTGLTSLIGAAPGLLSPGTPHYHWATLCILLATIALKGAIGFYTKSYGVSHHSDALTATGAKAIKNALFSIATLIVMALYLLTGLNLEAFLSVFIAILVIRSGLLLLKKTIGHLLGNRAPAKLSKEVKQTIASLDGVHGAYDLILHNYGPEEMQGSVHIEVEDTMKMDELDRIEREIVALVHEKHGIVLTGISIYAVDTKADWIQEVRTELYALAREYGAIGTHGFYLNSDAKNLSFDAVFDFDNANRRQSHQALVAEIQNRYPDYEVMVTMDQNYTD